MFMAFTGSFLDEEYCRNALISNGETAKSYETKWANERDLPAFWGSFQVFLGGKKTRQELGQYKTPFQ